MSSYRKIRHGIFMSPTAVLFYYFQKKKKKVHRRVTSERWNRHQRWLLVSFFGLAQVVIKRQLSYVLTQLLLLLLRVISPAIIRGFYKYSVKIIEGTVTGLLMKIKNAPVVQLLGDCDAPIQIDRASGFIFSQVFPVTRSYTFFFKLSVEWK